MSGVDNGGISFGKNKNINFDNFNGIHKEDFESSAKSGLTDSLFAKYDKNKDSILDEGELGSLQRDIQNFAKNNKLSNRETKKFFKTLGLENSKNLKRDDLYNFLQTVQADKDSIAQASTDSESGKTFVEFKPNENNEIKRIVYSNEADGSHKTIAQQTLYDENHVATTFYKEDGTTDNYDVKDNIQVRRVINQEGKPELLQETNKETNETVTTEYAEDGETVASKYRTNGSVTEFLDSANNDRVLARVTDKGNGVNETVQFTYNEDGSHTETTLDEAGKPLSTVTKKDGKEVRKSSVTTAEDGSTTEIITTGEGENIQRTKVDKDKEGNVTSRVNVDEDGNPVAYKHKVNDGENWYGIVEAKYGVSGYKTVMEIVHQLKKNAGVSRTSSQMPAELELPPTIKLKNGQEISLKDIEAQFDEINSVDARIDVSKITVPEDLPSAYPQDKLPAKKVTIPNEYLEVKPENAGKKITQSDGKVFEYDDKGKIQKVYNSEADVKAGNNSIRLTYDDSGNLSEYQLNDDDTNGHWVGAKVYGKDGKLSYFSVNEGINPETGNHQRQIQYNPDGSVKHFFDNYVYNDDGKAVKYDRFDNDNGQFAFGFRWEYKYSGDGKHVREIGYDSDGRLDEDNLKDA